MIYGDDQQKPDVGKQVADEMVKKHQVNFVSGVIWSNVMLAVAPSVTGAGTFMIGTNAGPHQLAGELCNELFFTTSWQNDQTPEAMGKYMQDAGLNDVYIMAPNYAAGKDMLTGFKRYFKGRIVGEVYTTVNQPDYQAELAAAARQEPEGGVRLLPRRHGDQLPQAVLRGRPARPVPAVLGLHGGRDHDPRGQARRARPARDPLLEPGPEERGQREVRRRLPQEVHGKTPSFYGAQSYDGIMLIDSAVRAVKGNLADKKGMIAAMRKADFKSTRGKFTYNHNHFPIQNFYLLKAVAGPTPARTR